MLGVVFGKADFGQNVNRFVSSAESLNREPNCLLFTGPHVNLPPPSAEHGNCFDCFID